MLLLSMAPNYTSTRVTLQTDIKVKGGASKHGQRVKFRHPGFIKGGVPITLVKTLNSAKQSIMHQVTASFKVKFKFEGEYNER